MRAPLLILDDLSARLVADGFRLPYTGTLGLLSRAKREGHLASIAPIIQEMIAVKFRMSDRLIKAVLSENGET